MNTFANQYIHVNLSIREIFNSAYMKDDKTIVLKGNFDEKSYFEMEMTLDWLSIKLSENNFNKIKDEILGKVNKDNVEYTIENPCMVKYNFTNVYEYKLG